MYFFQMMRYILVKSHSAVLWFLLFIFCNNLSGKYFLLRKLGQLLDLNVGKEVIIGHFSGISGL